MKLRKVGTITQSPEKKNSTPYQIWLMGMMDPKYDSRWGVGLYLELNGMNANEFGIDPDMTFNNSSEKDEDHIQAQSKFDHKIDEILEVLKKLFPELVDDEDHEIHSFRQVRHELLKIMLWACKYMQMVSFQLPKPTFCDVIVKWKDVWSIAH